MNRRVIGIAGLALVLALIAIVLQLSVPCKAANTTYTGTGYVAVSINSSFFNIGWGLKNGEAAFSFTGPNISNKTTVNSEGMISGTFDVTQFSFHQTFAYYDAGTMASYSEMPEGTITLLTFTGSGFIEQTINAGDLEGKTDLVAWMDADFFWLIIKDDRPERRMDYRLKLEAIGFDGPLVRMLVKNTGNIPVSGNTVVKCGLSYETGKSFSYSLTHFLLGEFGYIVIEPGQTVPFDFFLPETIPAEAISEFMREREEKRFASPWWQYPDPWTDCLDFIIMIGDQTNLDNHVHGFSPILVLAN